MAAWARLVAAPLKPDRTSIKNQYLVSRHFIGRHVESRTAFWFCPYPSPRTDGFSWHSTNAQKKTQQKCKRQIYSWSWYFWVCILNGRASQDKQHFVIQPRRRCWGLPLEVSCSRSIQSPFSFKSVQTELANVFPPECVQPLVVNYLTIRFSSSCLLSHFVALVIFFTKSASE